VNYCREDGLASKRGPNIFTRAKFPLSKRRIEIIETHLTEKDAFMR
jgi:hypothetical protein